MTLKTEAASQTNRYVTGVALLAILVGGMLLLEWRTSSLGLFEDSLDEARASLAMGDTRTAKQFYLEHIRKNLSDPQPRLELIELYQSEMGLEEALSIAKQLMKDFPEEVHARVYQQIVQAIHDQSDLAAQDALRSRDKEAFQKAVAEAQRTLLISPVVVFAEDLAQKKEVFSLGIRINNEADKCPFYERICIPIRWNQNQRAGSIAKFVFYEIYKEAQLSLVFGFKLNEVLRPDAIVLQAETGFSSAAIVDAFGSNLIFEDWVEYLVAGKLLEISRSRESVLRNEAIDRCLELTRRGNTYLGDVSSINVRRGLARACRSIQLELAIDSFSLENVENVLSEWKSDTSLFWCRGLNGESDCHKSMMMHTYDVIPVEDRQAQEDNLNWEPVDRYIFHYLQREGLNEKAGNAFDRKDWGESVRLYRELAELRERFGLAEGVFRGVTAEIRYNLAMALWGSDQRAEAITELEIVVEKYPDYEFGKPKLDEFRVAYKFLLSQQALSKYLSLRESADEYSRGEDNRKTAEVYTSAAEEYRRQTGRDDPFTLVRAWVFIKYIDPLKASSLIERAFDADSEFSFDNGSTVGDIKAEWDIQRPYEVSRFNAENYFSEDQWKGAFSEYSEAEMHARRAYLSGNERFSDYWELAAESAYNSAMSLKNDDQWRRARSILKRVRRDYPAYKAAIIAEFIREIDRVCPNRYLGC